MIVRFAALGVLASGAAAQADAPVLDCKGAFAKTADEASLVRAFGKANVVAATLDGAEGSTERGTVLFPKDPARRIEIFWHDVAKRRRPAAVVVKGASTWAVRAPGNAGRTVAVKASLEDVETANERPFPVTGFGWDMGGYSAGWKGGKLDGIEGGCSLSVRFGPDPKARPGVLGKVSGDREFGSSDAAVRAVKPTVQQLSVGWPE